MLVKSHRLRQDRVSVLLNRFLPEREFASVVLTSEEKQPACTGKVDCAAVSERVAGQAADLDPRAENVSLEAINAKRIGVALQVDPELDEAEGGLAPARRERGIESILTRRQRRPSAEPQPSIRSSWSAASVSREKKGSGSIHSGVSGSDIEPGPPFIVVGFMSRKRTPGSRLSGEASSTSFDPHRSVETSRLWGAFPILCEKMSTIVAAVAPVRVIPLKLDRVQGIGIVPAVLDNWLNLPS